MLPALSDLRLSFIFPAFSSDYENHPGSGIGAFDTLFGELLLRASETADGRLASFRFRDNNFLNDELLTQYVTFLYSCTLSALIRKAGRKPVVTAGYSMGIYSALYDAGSISFETGLRMIGAAYESITKHMTTHNYAMGALIGLNREDISGIIREHDLHAEITNQNAAHAFVVTGSRDSVTRLLELAMEEGALHSRDLGVTVPYHSEYLRKASEIFSTFVDTLEVGSPTLPVLSLVDHSLLTTPEQVRREVVRNLYRPLNWAVAMKSLLGLGITGFVECGPATGLSRNARFVEGVTFYPPASLLS